MSKKEKQDACLPRSYVAMLAEAKRVSWPEQFMSDLTTHDLAAARKRAADIPVFWVLMKGGTFACEISVSRIDAKHYVWDAPAWFPKTFGDDFRFYVWDGIALVSYGPDPYRMSEVLRELAQARKDREHLELVRASNEACDRELQEVISQ
jgi:hypothetical protein